MSQPASSGAVMNRRTFSVLLGAAVAALAACSVKVERRKPAPIDGLLKDAGYTGPFLYLGPETAARFIEAGYPPYKVKIVGPMVKA